MKRKNKIIASIILITLILIFGIFVTKEFLVSNLLNIGKKLEGRIIVSASEKIGIINPDIYGLFMEMKYREFNEGIWAEMLMNRKFAGNDAGGVLKPWFPIGKNEKTYFVHDNTVYYCGVQSQKIVSKNEKIHRSGIGQGELYLEKGKGYEIRLNLKQKDITSPVIISLEGENEIYSQKEIIIKNTDWNRFSFAFDIPRTDKNGRFTISFKGSGTLWVGSASLMPDNNMSGLRKDVVEALKTMHPPNLRWPGGNIVSCYHWENGIGDRDKRSPVFTTLIAEANDWETNDVGIDEFIELCRLIGTEPYVALNSGNGTSEEAANLVEYCNESINTKYGKMRAINGHIEPYNVKLWGIGNEMFGSWQVGHVDEETYARRHLEFAKAILAVDKDIKIVAVGGRYWMYPRWNQALFKIAGEYFDYLALHSYAKKYRNTMQKKYLKDPKFAEEFYYYIVSSPYGIEEQIIETNKEIREALPDRPEVTIAFDEWNCWAYREPLEEVEFAMRDGIYTAGIFHAFRRQLNAVTLANFSKIVNALPMIRVNKYGMFLNPQYLAFKMYINHSGSTLLRTDVKCKSFPAPEYERGRPQAKGNIPFLDVSTTISKDENIIYMAVINLHADKNIKTQVSLEQWDFYPEVKIFELYDDDYMTENTFEHPDRLTIKEEILNDISNPFNYNFKPHSVTIMKFAKK